MIEKSSNFHTVHFGDLLSVAIVCISIIGISVIFASVIGTSIIGISIICISVGASVISSIIVPTTSANTEKEKNRIFREIIKSNGK